MSRLGFGRQGDDFLWSGLFCAVFGLTTGMNRAYHKKKGRGANRVQMIGGFPG